MKRNNNANYQPFVRGALTVACLAALAVPASAADSLADALTGGKVSANLRYRYEWVDQEGVAEKAGASTMRTVLGYTTGDYHGFGGFVQFEDVHVVGNERYNSTINGLTQYPVVADPADTEVNQAYLSFKGIPGTTFKYGRQAIIYDNHRFIGNVGWRQNEQTYDAFSLVNSSLPSTVISFAHVDNANRIFSEKHPTLSDVEMNGELLNVAYKGLKAGALVGYGYFLDYEPGQPFPITASNKTLGVRFDGGYPLGGTKLLYTAEYAKQSDYKDGASTVDADYGYAMLGVDLGGVQIKFNYELLSGDGVYGFATPLATLHAFNGWADKFLTTPKDGIKDAYISVGGAWLGVNLLAIYHDYSSDNLGYRYGSEWNALASKKLDKNLTLTAKYAAYNGDPNSPNQTRNPAPAALARDIDKVWLQADWQF
ncbi:MAG: alginate export family protein [Gammaproteobacteria bacterium]|nr:alginate export family protein [Gammaproteobacteria bacterium]